MGRLTAAPQTKTFPSGNNNCRFNLAVDRRYKQSDEQPKTDFSHCVAWGKTADFICKYFDKGSLIAVVGELQTQSWEYQGKKEYRTEAVISEVYFTGERRTESEQYSPATISNEADYGFSEIEDDPDLPF